MDIINISNDYLLIKILEILKTDYMIYLIYIIINLQLSK